MKLLVLTLPLLAACKLIAGIDDTKLIAHDASVDTPVDEMMEIDAKPVTSIDVGNGAEGDLNVTTMTFTDSVRTKLTRNVGVGSTLIEVASVDGFAMDDELVVIQMIGADVGKHETHRVLSTAPGSITLTTPLEESYVGEGASAQVIRVPNYRNVTIPMTGVLTARAWDGETGGVVFFRANGVVTIDGTITVDGLAGNGAPSPGITTGGAGGMGGSRAGVRACPALCNTVFVGFAGDPGLFSVGEDGSLGNSVQMCRGGSGGRGGAHGEDGEVLRPGIAAIGPGSATDPGVGGANITEQIDRPALGGGGASGSSGAAGRGAGGGGGGGGCVGNGNLGGNGTNGDKGGDGGAGGAGGPGGGIVIVHAASIVLSGRVDARGIAGAAGLDGLVGGTGGFGNFGCFATVNCSGVRLHGGRGGGGNGGNGGDGGSGGGAGAGGTIVLNAKAATVTASGGAFATGGGMSALGGAGMPGGPGASQTNTATFGLPGNPGIEGGAAGNGFSYIRFLDSCTGCPGIGEPITMLVDL